MYEKETHTLTCISKRHSRKRDLPIGTMLKENNTWEKAQFVCKRDQIYVKKTNLYVKETHTHTHMEVVSSVLFDQVNRM